MFAMPAAQKIMFSIKDFLLKESLIGNFIFCALADADADAEMPTPRFTNDPTNDCRIL